MRLGADPGFSGSFAKRFSGSFAYLFSRGFEKRFSGSFAKGVAGGFEKRFSRGQDGRRWLQPPFLGISGQGDTISGGFNRRSVFRCQVRPVPTPVAEADRTSSFSGSGVLGYGG